MVGRTTEEHTNLQIPVTHCGEASHPDKRHSMISESMVPKPTLQVYVAVDPISVEAYTAAAAFTTTGGGLQSVLKVSLYV